MDRWWQAGMLILIAAGTGLFLSRSPRHSADVAISNEFRGRAMGAAWRVQFVADTPQPSHHELQRQVVDLLERMEQELSHWRPDSTLSQFNRAPANEWCSISPMFAEILVKSRMWSRESGGAFDITVGPLVEAWGFGPSGPRAAAPDDATIAACREVVGSQHWQLDQTDVTAPRLRKLKDGVRLDLSAIAPGDAADRIAYLLAQRGLHNFLIDVGGEMRARGMNASGRDWTIGLEAPDPHSVGRIRRTVPLRNAALATSGDYRRYRINPATGRRESHILDPRTGRPIAHSLVSVTVIADTAIRADALATTLMVLGPEAGYEFAMNQKLAAYFLWETEGRFIEKWTSFVPDVK